MIIQYYNFYRKNIFFLPVRVLWLVVFCTLKRLRNIILSISSKMILQMATSQYYIELLYPTDNSVHCILNEIIKETIIFQSRIKYLNEKYISLHVE